MTFTAQHDAPPYDPAYDSAAATSSTTEAFDVDAHVEAGILANLFNSPDDLNAVRDLITEDDFLEPRHAVTFAAMCAVVDNGKALTPTLVAQHLRAQNLLNAVGGTEALALLIDPQEASLYDAPADVFAEILRDNSLRRSLEGVGRELIRDAGVSSTTLAQDALSNAQSRLVEAQNRFAVGQNAEGDDRSALMQMMLDLESHARTDEGISTGIPALTEALNGGWKDRSLNVLAARPGVGKSMLACDFAREAAVTQGLRVLFFSLEMTRKELQVRLVSAQSQIPSKLIARNNVADRDLPVVRTAIESIADAPLRILDDSAMTLADITREAYAAHQTEGVDLIVLDYLQLVRPGKDDAQAPRHVQVGNVANGLRTLAQRLEVPVIALAQLNRDVEKRGTGGSNKPRLSDLRESGAIEQEAATILFLHREESDDATDHTLATYSLSMPKNRFGEGHGGIPLLGRLEVAQFVPGEGRFPAATAESPALENTVPAPDWAVAEVAPEPETGAPVWGPGDPADVPVDDVAPPTDVIEEAPTFAPAPVRSTEESQGESDTPEDEPARSPEDDQAESSEAQLPVDADELLEQAW